MGDRIRLIEHACRMLDDHDLIRVRRTSGLWETKAMYVLDQADFLNGVCEVETTLDPIELLDQLQRIEIALHRKKVIEKGPRTIDLDILLYDDEEIEHERLGVPHRLMLERGFVLQPLCELIPSESHPAGPERRPYTDYLAKLSASDKPTTTLTPLCPSLPYLSPLLPSRSTQVMSILNLTPDSFSDGGLNAPSDLTSLSATVRFHLSSGATMIDIGGQSTRPHAPIISASEEISRVIPAIRKTHSIISSSDTSHPAAISIDTFRASVARAAIEAGADIVNDVSAGNMDPEMLPTVAELGCTVILMHMRGDPATMTSKEHTSYPGGLIETVGAELLARVQAAEQAGIRRWRIILDPGIGFAKTVAQNLELLRRFAELRDYPGLKGLPWLVGASRKGFIGKITGVQEPRERTWGTAAVIAAAVQGGADVVRVHDVDEMAKVAKMADAVWRV